MKCIRLCIIFIYYYIIIKERSQCFTKFYNVKKMTREAWSFKISKQSRCNVLMWRKSSNFVTSTKKTLETGGFIMPDMGVSENRGFSPKSSILNRVFHYKPSILGYP